MKQYLVPNIHRDGWVFIAIFAMVTFIIGLESDALAWIGAILTGWCVYFFRDPDRVTPVRAGLVVSPADGLIQSITEATPPQEMGLKKGKYTRISIFLSVFDVHVNRVPIGGKIIKSIYHPGKFFNASLDKASIHNERQSLVVLTEDKQEIGFVQIAGLIARRIRCDVEEDQKVKTGQRFGMIRFGSRMDVYLPKETPILVLEGQRAVGGETILADFKADAGIKSGEKH